jgi:hypothetical protein
MEMEMRSKLTMVLPLNKSFRIDWAFVCLCTKVSSSCYRPNKDAKRQRSLFKETKNS